MPTASILVRLSKQAGDTNLSLSGMEDDCRALAVRHGYNVHAVRVDDGMSGAIRDRPGFLAWLDDATSGAADCLVTWSGDRLTREGVNAAARVLDVIEGKDPSTGRVVREPVRFLDCDGLDSSTAGDGFRFSFVIKAEIARGERERIVARTRATQRRLRTEVGRFRGGEPPYGYAKAPREAGGWTLVPDPDESAVVRDVAARVLRGESLYSITQDLNAREIATRRGGPWRIPTLQSMMTGPHAAGYARHHGQPIRDEEGRPVRWFEPLLDDHTLAQLRGIVRPPSAKRHAPDLLAAAPPPTARRRPKVTRLLSGLIRSSCCDSQVYAISPSPTKPAPIYRQPHGMGCGRQVSINAEGLEAHVENEFLRRFGRLAEMRPVHTIDEHTDLATIDRDLRELAQALTDPTEDHARLIAQVTAMHEQRAKVAARTRPSRGNVAPTGLTLAEAWGAAPLQARNTILAAFLDGPILVAPVGRARKRASLDVDRVSVPWRGAGHERQDYLAGQA